MDYIVLICNKDCLFCNRDNGHPTAGRKSVFRADRLSLVSNQSGDGILNSQVPSKSSEECIKAKWPPL